MHSLIGSAALAAAAVFFLIWLEQKVMKLLIFLALMAGAVWLVAVETGKTKWLGREGREAEKYAAGLQTDAQRAQAAKNIADKIVGQENQIKRTLQQEQSQVRQLSNP